MESSKNNKHSPGQLLVEILISIGVFMIFVGGFMLFAVDASRFTTYNAKQLEGKWLGEESYDALNDIWNQSFSKLTNGTHGLIVNNQNEWTLSANPDVHGDLMRQIIISNATRNGSGSLATTGIPDANTKKIIANVTSITTGTQIFSDIYYFPNIDGLPVGLSWLRTTRNDFRGTHQSTRRTNYNGGAIELRNNQTTGRYTSRIFNTGSNSTTWSSVIWNGSYDLLSNIRIQTRFGRTRNQINNATFVGPDGTSSTYFSPSDTIIIPLDAQGTRRIQYRVEFTKSGSTDPILEDIEIFYAL